jgi:signal peptide peptidase SppA
MPEILSVMCDVVLSRSNGITFTAEEVAAKIGAADSRRESTQAGSVAIIPIYGVLAQRVDMLDEMSGATSTQRIAKDFTRAINDPGVGAIVLDNDTPGGSVYYTAELSQMIFDARGTKPIVSVANSLSASAGYWIGSSADEFVITPGGEAGSIGVISQHIDMSKAMDTDGIDITLISAGRFKTEGNPFEGLGDVAKDALQSRVNEYYDMFISAIAGNRTVNAESVKAGFGEGRVVGADEAVKIGMADSVDTLENVITRLSTRDGQKAASNTRRLALAELG